MSVKGGIFGGIGALGIFGIVVASIFGLALLGVWLNSEFSILTAETRGETGVREKTVADPDYRIAAYEEFYDKCAAIKAVEQQIDTMQATKGLPKNQKSTNILALTNQRNTLIQQYNADSRKAGTRGQFRASDLPYQIDTTQEHTSC